MESRKLTQREDFGDAKRSRDSGSPCQRYIGGGVDVTSVATSRTPGRPAVGAGAGDRAAQPGSASTSAGTTIHAIRCIGLTAPVSYSVTNTLGFGSHGNSSSRVGPSCSTTRSVEAASSISDATSIR